MKPFFMFILQSINQPKKQALNIFVHLNNPQYKKFLSSRSIPYHFLIPV